MEMPLDENDKTKVGGSSVELDPPRLLKASYIDVHDSVFADIQSRPARIAKNQKHSENMLL